MNTAHKDDLLEDQPQQAGMTEEVMNRIAELVAEKVFGIEQPSLWSVKEIATFLKLSERHVQDRVVKSPNFPKGFLIPGAGKIKSRVRWKKDDVIDWADPNA